MPAIVSGADGGASIEYDLLPDVLEGRIQPGRIFDSVIGIEETSAGFQAMDKREAIKVMIEF